MGCGTAYVIRSHVDTCLSPAMTRCAQDWKFTTLSHIEVMPMCTHAALLGKLHGGLRSPPLHTLQSLVNVVHTYFPIVMIPRVCTCPLPPAKDIMLTHNTCNKCCAGVDAGVVASGASLVDIDIHVGCVGAAALVLVDVGNTCWLRVRSSGECVRMQASAQSFCPSTPL